MVNTKQCILILAIIVLIITGSMYTYTVLQPPRNNTNESPTIIVNGDGSSGTGDVTNTQVVQVETKHIQQNEGIIDTSSNEEVIVGDPRDYNPKDANPK